jgi:hypothetical protein
MKRRLLDCMSPVWPILLQKSAGSPDATLSGPCGCHSKGHVEVHPTDPSRHQRLPQPYGDACERRFASCGAATLSRGASEGGLGGLRPQQHLFAHDDGAAFGDCIAAPLGERREAFQAARKKLVSRQRDRPLAHLARARDRAGDDRNAGPRKCGEVGDDRVIGALLEQPALRRGRDDGAACGEAAKQARERRGVVPVVGVVLEFDLEPMQRGAGRGERKKGAGAEGRPFPPRIEDVDRDRTSEQRPAKGKGASGSNREAESTDAPERGGLSCSSAEAG